MASLSASPYVSSRSLMRVSSSTLFDDAIGPDQDRRRDAKADAARDALVDRQRDPALLLDRHQARVGALEDLLHELRHALEAVEHARLVADEATRVGEFLPPVHRGDTLAVRELRDLLTPDQRQGIREHEHGPGAARADVLERRLEMPASGPDGGRSCFPPAAPRPRSRGTRRARRRARDSITGPSASPTAPAP